ncbi:unnamed protein product, partial [Durusdinium trenchii]
MARAADHIEQLAKRSLLRNPALEIDRVAFAPGPSVGPGSSDVFVEPMRFVPAAKLRQIPVNAAPNIVSLQRDRLSGRDLANYKRKRTQVPIYRAAVN